MMLSLFAFVLFMCGAYAQESSTTPIPSPSAQLLKIEVFYGTLCSDSMVFMRNQLHYAMIDNNWLQYTDLHFIPYGKVASWTDPTTNETSLYCQHGHTECELNALHACIVENHSIVEQLKLINCLMASYSSAIDRCASLLDIDVTAAKNCKATRSTGTILQKYGEQTDALDIDYVPTVTINGNFDRWRQRSISYYFDSAFCKKYKEKFNIKLPKC